MAWVKKRYIERFVSQIVPERQEHCFYVHSGLSYNAFLAITGTTISLSDTAGTITITADENVFVDGHFDKRIRAVDSYGNITGELQITNVSSDTVAIGTVKYPFEGDEFGEGEWAISVSEISGLDHLEGKTVTVLADGGTDKPDKVVSGGTIDLAYNYFYVTVGLPCIQKLKTLPQEVGSQRGTSQGKIQRISELGFKVNNSFKGFYVGGSESDLLNVRYALSEDSDIIFEGTIPNDNFIIRRIQFRDPTTLLGTAESLYTGIIPNISFHDGYRYGSQVLIYNDTPLPIELLNIITTISTEDK